MKFSDFICDRIDIMNIFRGLEKNYCVFIRRLFYLRFLRFLSLSLLTVRNKYDCFFFSGAKCGMYSYRMTNDIVYNDSTV